MIYISLPSRKNCVELPDRCLVRQWKGNQV